MTRDNAVLKKDSMRTGVRRLIVVTIVVLVGVAMTVCLRGGDLESRMRAVAARADRWNLKSDDAAKELAQIAREAGGVSKIVELLRKDENLWHTYWWEALEQLGPEASSALPFMVESLKSDKWHRRHAAAIVLGSMGGSARAAVPSLCEAMASGDGNLRWYAAAALGNIGFADTDAVNVLRHAEKDDDVTVRFFAKAALLKLGHDDGTLPFLIKELTESDSQVRNAAVLALGYLGPKASAAMPELKTLADDDDSPSVKRNAEQALEKMTGR